MIGSLPLHFLLTKPNNSARTRVYFIESNQNAECFKTNVNKFMDRTENIYVVYSFLDYLSAPRYFIMFHLSAVGTWRTSRKSSLGVFGC